MSKKKVRAALAVCTVGLVLAATTAGVVNAQSSAANVVRCKANVGKKAAHQEVEGFITQIDLVKFYLSTRFCYNGRRVINPGHTCKTEVRDHLLIQADGCNTSGFFVPWRGNPRGGYYVIGSFGWKNCFFIELGCFISDVVNIERYLWADGLVTKNPRN